MRKEGEPQQIQDDLKYEEITRTPYSELGEKRESEPELGWRQWGRVRYKGRWASHYLDEELIKDYFTKVVEEATPDKTKDVVIADLGGGEGVVLDRVFKQLRESGYEHICPVNVEKEHTIDKTTTELTETDKGLGRMAKMQKAGKINPFIAGYRADILDTFFDENKAPIDITISRMVLQYFPEDKQEKFLKSVYRMLHKGGKFILYWPGGENKEKTDGLNEIEAQIIALALNKKIEDIKKGRHQTSIEEFIEIVEKTGFQLERVELSDVEVKLNAETWATRLKIDPKEMDKIQEIIEKARNKILEVEFSEEEGLLCYDQPYCYAVLTKPINR